MGEVVPHDVLLPDPSRLALHLDGFEGPLDLLLDLARAQKVDMARISILALVEQYLTIVEGAQKVRLEVAADWLVMAAWLTWLKSRLLLPDDPDAAEEAEEAAESLAARLQALASIRAAAAWLIARPQLGQDVFARGQPEIMTEIDRSALSANIPRAGPRLPGRHTSRLRRHQLYPPSGPRSGACRMRSAAWAP